MHEHATFWNAFGVILAGYCILAYLRHRRLLKSDKTIVLQRPSTMGRIGGALMAHVILSTINGILGFNVIISILCIVLSVPLMIFGVKVEFPDHIKAWPRGVIAKVSETWGEAKEEIKEKIHEKKEAVMDRFGRRTEAPDTDDAKPIALNIPNRRELEAKAAELKEKAEEEIRLRMWEEAGRRTRKLIFFWE